MSFKVFCSFLRKNDDDVICLSHLYDLMGNAERAFLLLNDQRAWYKCGLMCPFTSECLGALGHSVHTFPFLGPIWPGANKVRHFSPKMTTVKWKFSCIFLKHIY